ncbi:hypothetical protein N658DRAFT_73756 [Parathielavia hyrcaniae]|uniref:Uncharacterized protein n=1 Tax=Parathielavia hyrcaniae TaxID=113614 RepID=A0AAN6PQ60_9PEZI|nr:hypothetical protein N658DRAFT_73756 [Parathielavia hyrcaniae]
MKLFTDASQHTEHSSNALEPLHSTIKQPPNCQNVSSFLFFPKLSVLVESSPASCNIHLGPLQTSQFRNTSKIKIKGSSEGELRKRGREEQTQKRKTEKSPKEERSDKTQIRFHI